MIQLTLFVAFIAAAFYLQVRRPASLSPALARLVSMALMVMALFQFASTSFYIVDQDKVGHMKRIYLADPLPTGHIIAVGNQKGPQAEILGPGFHFVPFIRVLYDIEEKAVVTVPEGQMAVLIATDGEPLKEGQYIARGWGQGEINQMLDAHTFLTEGGQKGVQLTVLPPGQWRFNQYLFAAQLMPSLEVAAGHVAVVKSNVSENEGCPTEIPESDPNSVLASPIVPKGCIGVWDEPLMPGRYFLNPKAYQATILPTTVQTWSYRGGYTTRRIDLTVGEDGKIVQHATTIDEPVPPNSADKAIMATVEGWRVPLEMRMLVQVNPKDAPRVVASVGELQAVEDKIATPGVRSVVRNITGEKTTKVLELINQRAMLEKKTEEALAPELFKAGVTLKEIRFGDPVIPPELLVARQREQLALQLQETYAREKEAQHKRIEVEKARAEAQEQGRLMAASIDVQVAEKRKEEGKLLGEAEKLKLMEIAKGESARANVLGKDAAKELAMLKEILAAAQANPEIVKVPTVNVQGAGTSLEGAAAVLGASNIVKWAQPPAAGKK